MARQQSKQRSGGDKTRFELRFDADVYEGIKRLADEADLSINQLMQGIARGLLGCAHVGEPEYDEDTQTIRSKPQPGCVWFGHADYELVGERSVRKPEMYFSLDFTERHVVRDDWDDQKGASDEQGT